MRRFSQAFEELAVFANAVQLTKNWPLFRMLFSYRTGLCSECFSATEELAIVSNAVQLQRTGHCSEWCSVPQELAVVPNAVQVNS
jgi:hypothetical protein